MRRAFFAALLPPLHLPLPLSSLPLHASQSQSQSRLGQALSLSARLLPWLLPSSLSLLRSLRFHRPAQLAFTTLFVLLPALGGDFAVARADAHSRVQDSGSAAEIDAKVARLIKLARTASPVIRPQAAKRLLALGEAAATQLLLACGVDGEELATLGPELVAILPALGNERLDEYCWAALRDRDFPWRPAAAKGLATSIAAGETEENARAATAFLALLDDPIVQVRRSAIDALARLDLRSARAAVRARLADERGEVRRRAADLLASWGELAALWTLAEELQRSDRFFSIPVGRSARHEAWKMLRPRLSADTSYDPELEPAQNAAALAQIRSQLQVVAGACPQLPDIARALPAGSNSSATSAPSPNSEAGAETSNTDQAAFGVELRSCRRGEFFLRWTTADELLVGLGSPARIALEAGTLARLEAKFQDSLQSLGPARFWGSPGCDFERFHLDFTAERTEVLLVSTGPDLASEVRPTALGLILPDLLATLPTSGKDPRLHNLRARVRATFEAVGGSCPLPATR